MNLFISILLRKKDGRGFAIRLGDDPYFTTLLRVFVNGEKPVATFEGFVVLHLVFLVEVAPVAVFVALKRVEDEVIELPVLPNPVYDPRSCHQHT